MEKMEIVKNELDGMYALPRNHPVTCLNPAPWRIDEVKICKVFSRMKTIWKIYIRNEKSCWFGANKCIIGSKDELEEEMKFINKE
jgi:hypothetical protein